VSVRGKFLQVDGRKFLVRGVTYGPFRPDANGDYYKGREDVARDFAAIAAAGANTVRTYISPPLWLVDVAEEHGLKVVVGVAWQQHVTFLDDARTRRAIADMVRATVRRCERHPAVLGYTLGNEIPSSIVRWYGPRKVERFLRDLFEVAKAEDPTALVTYVNYPATEYLALPFLDFLCFNVYVESPNELAAYVARLHNLADGRPLVLGEVGFDSMAGNEAVQASAVDWQIRIPFAGGCAGVCVFSWTDEWFRDGYDINDWAFGLTSRARNPKPALESTRKAFQSLPFPDETDWPKVSVIVCTYNGARYLRETCEALRRVDYPEFEVIVVCDGSTDDTMAILADFDFRVIPVAHGGLSRARNVGLEAATGEIIAYLDDDGYPETDWLKYLAWSFMHTRHGGIGGPNFPPPDDDFWALCVAHSPGGPNHVLLEDDLAEHIPGCNMAFRKSVLEQVGGFDEDFQIAGDDVDICWKVQETGGTIGFSPAAVVWHHRRNSVPAYLRQQFNYGRAEAMLAAKWPPKFNSAGHVRWDGKIYGNGRATPALGTKVVVYQGTWGSAPFQSIYEKPAGFLSTLTMMPEWHFVVGMLAAVCALGFVWRRFAFALIAFVPAVIAQIMQSMRGASAARFPNKRLSRTEYFCAKLTIGVLHYLQPLTRMRGRIVEELGPFRLSLKPLTLRGFKSPWFWYETWLSKEARLEVLERKLQRLGVKTIRSDAYDSWDLEIVGGLAGRARALMAIEEHGAGRQLVRYRIEPRFSLIARAMLGSLTLVMLVYSLLGAHAELLVLSILGSVVGIVSMLQALAAAGLIHQALEQEDIGQARGVAAWGAALNRRPEIDQVEALSGSAITSSL
jgi:GT2 family glycosyltransferase